MLNLFSRAFIYPAERSIVYVPRMILAGLLVSLIMQSGMQYITFRQSAEFRQIPPPPTMVEARLMSLSDMTALSKMAILWLQSYDAQPGISVSFKQLEYDRVIQWLDLILRLDPKADSPLLAASRVYAEVNDKQQQRKMLEFVHTKFLESPDTRWPSMAHAVYVAKHKLKDLELALDYARDMANLVTDKDTPQWIRQMHIYVLEDMGELESAKILIGGLLESGKINDEQEIRFLQLRLKQLEEKTENHH